MEKLLADKLNKALGKIDRPGAFSASGSVPAILPGLEVKGLGPIALPLVAKQAKELIEHCEQAPYGKGTETVVDSSVRRVWRLTPERFTLANADWINLIKDITTNVQKTLGLEEQKLEAHLYDLLVYEPGGFFLPHKDGEKLDRMVATLVIVLPSAHQGGELVVRHDGREEVIDFSRASNAFQIHYAAFYADCEHEIRPIREGYRLCLVYNVTLAKGKKGIEAPRASKHIEEIAGLLREWANDPEAQKLVITLDHEYTEKGLSWDALKGADRALADIVADAAQQAECRAYLGLLTFWESGSGHSSDDDYGYHGRWRKYDEEDEEDESAGDYEMEEVFDTSLTVKNGRDRTGNPMPFDELLIDEETDLLDPEALRAVKPEEEFEGYTGNAGMTLERWYRHAAVVLWPEKRHFAVVCDQSPEAGLQILKTLVGQWQKANSKNAAALKESCSQLANAVVASWRPNSHGSGWDKKPEQNDLLMLLDSLDDRQLIDRFVTELLMQDVTLNPGKALTGVCQKYGWQTFAPSLLTLFKNTNPASMSRNIRLLEDLASAEESQSGLCHDLGQELLAVLERIDTDKTITDWHMRNLNREAVFPELVRALIVANQPELLMRLVEHALEHPKEYPLAAVHLSAIKKLEAWLKKDVATPPPGLTHWLAACREQLEKLTAEEPQEPTDFRRPADVACKCKLCHELNQYLANPAEKVHRFMAPKEVRGHLEHRIGDHRCDVDMTTERTRPSHTLVCSKNMMSYERNLKKYHEDLQHLARVQEIEAAVAKNGTPKASLRKRARNAVS